MKKYVLFKKLVALCLITLLFIGIMIFIKNVENSQYEIDVHWFKFLTIYSYVGFVAFELLFFLYYFSGAIDNFPRLFKKDKNDDNKENKDGQ